MGVVALTEANIRVSASANLVLGRAASAIAIGDVVYRSSNDEWALASAKSSGIAGYVDNRLGVAISAAPAKGQPVIICLEDNDYTHGLDAWAEAKVAFLSNTNPPAGSYDDGLDDGDFVDGDVIIMLIAAVSPTKGIFRPTLIGTSES